MNSRRRAQTPDPNGRHVMDEHEGVYRAHRYVEWPSVTFVNHILSESPLGVRGRVVEIGVRIRNCEKDVR